MEKIWKTNIAGEVAGETVIRGYKLTDLIGQLSFTQTIFLTLKGELPTEVEEKMLGAILVASVDHGLGAPSTTAARIVASGGNKLHVGVAAGVLALGKHHGGAIKGAAKIFQENIDQKSAEQLVADFEAKDKRLPGFGHKIYEVDPRTEKIVALAKDLGFGTRYIDYALAIGQELESKKGKKLPLNIDGIIACVVSEMGFDYEGANAFFIIPRVVGLSAHVQEELTQEKPVRRLSEDDLDYTGPKDRKL